MSLRAVLDRRSELRRPLVGERMVRWYRYTLATAQAMRGACAPCAEYAMRKIKRPVARPTDPSTSWEAAASLKPDNIRESQAKIMKVLLRAGPMTDQEIYGFVQEFMSESGARTRRKELVDYGLVRDSGRRATTASGRSTIVWEAATGVERANDRQDRGRVLRSQVARGQGRQVRLPRDRSSR